MTILCVPPIEEDPWPTLGPQVCAFIESYLVFGPGDLRGEPARLDPEKRAFIHRMYEVYPRAHQLEGRRRFKRVALSLRKGLAKTELAAWIAACELHRDGPVRCVSWGSRGDPTIPVGDGVKDPYIPMVAYTEEQSEELAYGALYFMLTEGPLANDFDAGLERIMRNGGDGKAVALANSPNAREGARTTFQHFDETHLFTLERLKRAHRTMMANLPKRYQADAWALETTTAYSPGELSIAEETMDYARAVDEGRAKGTDFFFFHREAGDRHDVTTKKGLRAAVIEASGPDAVKWSDIDRIVRQWDDPTFDRRHGEQIWLNRPRQQSNRAFDSERWKNLAAESTVKERSLVTLGFDGSRYEDATALVATDIVSGHQWLAGLWEKPLGVQGEGWEVPRADVDAALTSVFERYDVWRLYADPWGWGSEIASWAARWGSGKDGKVYEWDTRRWIQIAAAVKNFATAVGTGELSHDGNIDLARHIGNACRRMLPQRDSDGVPLWVIQKERSDSPHKMDGAMAAVLSWEARTDAVSVGVAKPLPPMLSIDAEVDDEGRRPEFAGVRGAQF